jgi:Fe-S-cluster containining protein
MHSTTAFCLPVIEAPASSSPCEGCHAGCCRAYAVPLTGRDIFRIVTELKLPFWNFVCRWADPLGAIARDIAPHFYFDDNPQTPYVICLLQNESRLFPGTRKCRFLDESSAAEASHGVMGRCSIYEHRPVACRVFPARLDELGELAVHEVPESPGELQHAAYELCPRPWSVSDLDSQAARQNLRECAEEMELFHSIGSRWNENPGSWRLFPQFLDLVYRALAAA